jgi:DNA polymerase-3 subunit delta'
MAGISLQGVRWQDRAVRFVRRALRSGRAAHAYLLCGPEGAGRLSLARALSKAVLCLDPREGDACGECRSCGLMDSGAHPDHQEVSIEGWKGFVARRDGKSISPRDLPIEAVRELVIEPAQRQPRVGERRTFIIEDADRWSIQAANCFLKTLEEPPGGAVFVLSAGNTQNIPETILSRCQVVRLSPVAESALAEELSGEGCEAEEAAWAAGFASGSPARARSALESGLYGFFREMSEALDGLRLGDNLRLTDRVLEEVPRDATPQERRERIMSLLEGVLYYYRGRVLDASSADEVSRYGAAADVVMETIQAVASNASATPALDAMWTRLALAETGR